MVPCRPGPPAPGSSPQSPLTRLTGYDVKDAEHWLSSSKREEVFGPLGVTNIRTFVDPQNPTRVALLMDVADMDVVMGAMDSEAMVGAMAHDGVVGESLVILAEKTA